MGVCSLAILVRRTIHLYKLHTRNVCVCVLHSSGEQCVWGGVDGGKMVGGGIQNKIPSNYLLNQLNESNK